MNIVIFSGGTGSIQLSTGFKKLLNNNVKITNIINAYDDGKSTGICRDVFNVLGPSDIRKNQHTQWKNSQPYNIHINDFMEGRFSGNQDKILDIVNGFKFNNSIKTEIINAIINFFNIYKKDINNFNIANILYAYLFSVIGYKETINYMANFLNIQDNIIINSYINYVLNAKAIDIEKNIITLNRESEIVDFKNSNAYIYDIFFNCLKEYERPNLEMFKVIKNADILIVSTGSEWSSLIPTFKNKQLQKCIDDASCLKIKIVNNNDDNDTLGINSFDDILNEYKKLININDFYILYNSDANEKYRPLYVNNKIQQYSFGNKNGIHNGEILVSYIMNLFYMFHEFNKSVLFFDFDDTIYSRENKHNIVSIDNLKIINEIGKIQPVFIISGNSSNSVLDKVYSVFKESEFNVPIFTNNGLCFYDTKLNYNKEHSFLLKDAKNLVIELNVYFNNKFNIEIVDNFIDDENNDRCLLIKIKPICDDVIRKLVCDNINLIFGKTKPILAKVTGKTTIDIFNFYFDKSDILNFKIIYNKTVEGYNNKIYFGDECDFENGNDYNISRKCNYFYNFKSIIEFNVLLSLYLNFLKNGSK